MRSKHDYADRLESLAALHNRNPLHVLEMWLERSAIIEEGNTGMSRAEAERLAFSDVEKELG
jgi:hypothetical protein